MLQSPVASLFRLIAPSCSRHVVQRNLCRLSASSYLLQRNCLPLLTENKLVPGKLSQPISICLFQQRFASQISKAAKDDRKTKKNLKAAASQVEEVSHGDEEENDILYRRVQIEARCADRAVLDSYEKFVSMSANYLGITVLRVWEPFRTIKRRTLLRAAFVKKKYRVQYEWRTYYRCLEFKHLTGSTADTFLEYIERNLPESVALKVTRQQIEEIPSHLVPPAQSSSQ